jgi:hypothetical protein
LKGFNIGRPDGLKDTFNVLKTAARSADTVAITWILYVIAAKLLSFQNNNTYDEKSTSIKSKY